MPNGIPVGAQVTAIVSAPAGFTISKVVWSGLNGAKSSYFSLPAETTAANTPPYLGKQSFVQATQQPPAQTNVTFLVDPRQQNYSVTADVFYAGVAQDEEITGSFKSVAPSGTLTVISNLPANQAINGSPDGSLFSYRGLGTPYPNDAGIRFQAVTSIPNPGFAGQFMIMQTITPSRTYTDTNGQQYWMPPDNQVPPPGQPNVNYPTSTADLDNYTGTIGAQLQTYDAETMGTDAWPGGNHWSQNPGDPQLTLTTADPIQAPIPGNVQTASINNETANTYLMYMPTGGVWSAISAVQWSWSITETFDATNGNFVFTGQANPSGPMGAGYDPWPEWSGLTSNIPIDQAPNFGFQQGS